MTDKQIKKLADFFYGSNNASDVPLRLAIVTGRYTGHDLNKDRFIELMTILNNSTDLKEDLLNFREEVEDEEEGVD